MLTEILTPRNLEIDFFHTTVTDLHDEYSITPIDVCIQIGEYNKVWLYADDDMVTVKGRTWNDYGDVIPSSLCTVWCTFKHSNPQTVAAFVYAHIRRLLKSQS